jgi:Rod binding domain-containing protein
MRNWRLFNEGDRMSEPLKSVMNQAEPIITKKVPQTTRFDGTVPEGDKEKVCKSFESYFILNILQQLQKTTQFSKKGYTEQTYMSIVYEKVADYLADKGIGVKEMLMRYADKGNAKVLQKSDDNVVK